ncbi:MAG: peptidoglycan-associated lipoprotein Pal [Alphaproteobacteria bacterium]|nr:peptidoglycan-associated lipoprotein Pal [Alphaproteobacteria bacterium]
MSVFSKYCYLTLLMVLPLLVAACSSTNKELGDSDGMTIGQPEDITYGVPEAAVSEDGYGTASTVAGVESSAVPGSQDDLNVQAGDTVYFETDRYDLNAQARAVIEAQARWMSSYPSLYVTIEGHADERGTREYNLALGERRASSVKNYLIAMGVDPRRINVISYGKEQPVVVGADGSSWAQNRRARTRVQ